MSTPDGEQPSREPRPTASGDRRTGRPSPGVLGAIIALVVAGMLILGMFAFLAPDGPEDPTSSSGGRIATPLAEAR